MSKWLRSKQHHIWNYVCLPEVMGMSFGLSGKPSVDCGDYKCRLVIINSLWPVGILLQQATGNLWVLRWPIGSASASHQCSQGSIPGWGSDPGAVSEKGLSSLVWATLHPWVGTLSHRSSLPTSTNPIWGTLKNSQHFLKRVGESPWCWLPVLYHMH